MSSSYDDIFLYHHLTHVIQWTLCGCRTVRRCICMQMNHCMCARVCVHVLFLPGIVSWAIVIFFSVSISFFRIYECGFGINAYFFFRCLFFFLCCYILNWLIAKIWIQNRFEIFDWKLFSFGNIINFVVPFSGVATVNPPLCLTYSFNRRIRPAKRAPSVKRHCQRRADVDNWAYAVHTHTHVTHRHHRDCKASGLLPSSIPSARSFCSKVQSGTVPVFLGDSCLFYVSCSAENHSPSSKMKIFKCITSGKNDTVHFRESNVPNIFVVCHRKNIEKLIAKC